MAVLRSIPSGDSWERLFATRPWGAYPPEELVRFIARRFGATVDKSKMRVLEVGCGPGPNIWYLVREGFTVAGIDASPTAIRQAGERLVAEGLPHETPRVDLQVGNFERLAWPDDSFDAVIDIEAIYANPMGVVRAAMAEVKRTLKPGGVFFGKMFGPQTSGSESGEAIERGTRRHPQSGPCAGNEIAHFFSREELIELLDGFDDISLDYTHRTDQNGAIHIFEWIVSGRRR